MTKRRAQFPHRYTTVHLNRDGARVPDPQAQATFAVSRLHWDERDEPPHAGVLDLYRSLIALRRSERLLQPLVFAMDTHTVCVRYERMAPRVTVREERAPDGSFSLIHEAEVQASTADLWAAILKLVVIAFVVALVNVPTNVHGALC